VSLLRVFWLFGTLWALRTAILSTYRYYCTYLHVPTWVVSTILFPSIFHKKDATTMTYPRRYACDYCRPAAQGMQSTSQRKDDLSHEIRLRLLSACGSGDAVDVAARAPRITSKMERRDSVVAASSRRLWHRVTPSSRSSGCGIIVGDASPKTRTTPSTSTALYQILADPGSKEIVVKTTDAAPPPPPPTR
jgi:hypothetical protein